MTEEQIERIGTKVKFDEVLEKLQLTKRQRDIFILKYGEGLINIEIAEEIGWNRKVVSNEMKIIREKIKQLNYDF